MQFLVDTPCEKGDRYRFIFIGGRMAKPPFDLQKGHRWFAVELNNLGWEYVEADTRTDEETERMIHAAHGACFHWLEAGDLLNHLRAQCLLASAYAAAKLAEPAVRHAEKCLSLSEEAGGTQTPFDRAVSHGCAAIAYQQAGDTQRAHEQRRALEASLDGLDDHEAGVIDRLYRVPLTTSTD